jgi:four helix bundle protein
VEAMKTPIRSYRDLIAWQKAFALGLDVYEITTKFPDHERFGLTVQLRRGVVSIASNIAEGYGRGSRLDYVRFLKVARGSLYEIDTQLLFAVQFKYLTQDVYAGVKEKLDESERVLAGLITSLERSDA